MITLVNWLKWIFRLCHFAWSLEEFFRENLFSTKSGSHKQYCRVFFIELWGNSYQKTILLAGFKLTYLTLSFNIMFVWIRLHFFNPTRSDPAQCFSDTLLCSCRLNFHWYEFWSSLSLVHLKPSFREVAHTDAQKHSIASICILWKYHYRQTNVEKI